MSTAKATKKSAFSCEPCRRRKVKCGGEQPICQRSPTLSYTQRLEERIKELEDQIANLIKSPPSVAGSSHSSPPVSGVQDLSSQATRHVADEHGIGRSFGNLKIDGKGSITYHGATSFFNLPSDRTGPGSSDLPFLDTSSSDTDLQRRERLIHNAWHQRAMENLNKIPEPFQYLLNVHWCWIQPLFNFIYRPAFTRDMQSMGPYYSHTLLNAVISHSIRWGRSDPSTRRLLDDSYQSGLVFGKHARSMLFEELNNGVCTIPTIQTLLLLSAQECSQGNTTQAWTYSGIAFRLLDHLGICVDSQRFPGSVPLSDEELEIRRRIYWGCYFWDKLICLYLGRSPSLKHTNISPSHIMYDDSAENDLWVPFGIPQTDPTWKYPPTTAHSATCFMSMCRLAVIFNEILVHMYDPLSQNTDAEIQECLNSQKPLLQQWWDQLPTHLKIDPISLPNLAPPSHIVTLKTFSMNYCVLSLAYCVYIASSIFLLQVQAAPDDQQAMRKLTYCIQCLQQVRQISPVIASALNNINKELTVVGVPTGLTIQQSPQTHPSSTTGSSTPLSGSTYGTSSDMKIQTPIPSHPVYQPSFSQNFGPDAMSMEPGVFEAMSTLEPLSIRVGTISETENSSSLR
ncbi:hypothetical protein ED733_005968 [Metarhizium rileyi]|uniref:Xylanolytic transcriptional activator regulatory domain-containing protein n=1 Tax=Metarhizium rileyi (strain RCEF 4871) TaxID=1649241 RepID=A0A5C6GFQ1_METRR|nr:hypothetical protein ED733_005968 [Metarhizium rileyi]